MKKHLPKTLLMGGGDTLIDALHINRVQGSDINAL